MESDIVSTKYFGRLDLQDLPLDDTLFSLPIDGTATTVPVSFLIISVEDFSEGDRQNFLTALDTLPHIYEIAKQRICQEFSSRTPFRKRIKNKVLWDFITAAECSVPGLRIDSLEVLLGGLCLDSIAFGQGPFGEFCLYLDFCFGTECKTTLSVEFLQADCVNKFYLSNRFQPE